MLNDITVKNKYPLPLISKLINQLRGAKYFTKLDVRWGFNNVRIKEGDEWKAAFQTNRGLFEPLVMFFGLTNSPATFQTMMNDIFTDMITEGVVVVYLDDILIFTKELPAHREVTCRILQQLADHGLYLRLKKCEFEQTKVKYLGLVVSENHVEIDPVKVARVCDWPEPRNKKEVQFSWALLISTTVSYETSPTMPGHCLTLPRQTRPSVGQRTNKTPSAGSEKQLSPHRSSSPPMMICPSVSRLTVLTSPQVRYYLSSRRWMISGILSPSCPSPSRRLKEIMKSMTRKCLQLSEHWRNGATFWKVHVTSLRYGLTTKTWNTS